jgi:hypothetical protein
LSKLAGWGVGTKGAQQLVCGLLFPLPIKPGIGLAESMLRARWWPANQLHCGDGAKREHTTHQAHKKKTDKQREERKRKKQQQDRDATLYRTCRLPCGKPDTHDLN